MTFLVYYRQHCAQRKAPVFKLLRGRFWGFSPRWGDTLHCPAGAYPLHDFHHICRICTPFQDVLAVKIFVGCAQGVMELWGF